MRDRHLEGSGRFQQPQHRPNCLDCPARSSDVWGMNDEANPESDERLADLRRRRAEAADVPAD